MVLLVSVRWGPSMCPCHLIFSRSHLPKPLLAASRGSGAWLAAFCLEFSLTLLLVHPTLGIRRNHRQQRPLEGHHTGILALNPVYISIQLYRTPQPILTPKTVKPEAVSPLVFPAQRVPWWLWGDNEKKVQLEMQAEPDTWSSLETWSNLRIVSNIFMWLSYQKYELWIRFINSLV